MLYPSNIEDKLKFTKIRQSLRNRCLSPVGCENVDAMSFQTDYDSIVSLLGEVREMLDIRQGDAEFPAAEFPDLREGVKRLRVEGLYLEEPDLAELCKALKQVKSMVRFFETSEENAYPLLKARTADVPVYPVLIDRIDSILDKFGHVKDNASSELAQIRRDIASKQSAVSKRLLAIMKQAQSDGIVEADASVSIRDGRAVIPVPSGNKRRISGIVLDESSTGRTSYIEPAEIVAMNNDLRELHYAERREVIRILTDMSSTIRPYIAEIIFSFEYLGYIDFVRAKAIYAYETESVKPVVEPRQGMYWASARHPLLYLQLKEQSRPIVPLDIELEPPSQRILIISGPNAGGKSVCLQTVGLVQYMMQCGMLVPMAESSKMGIFNDIFIDMGDEQSMENDLSTYSSHLTNMKHFVRYSNPSTLVLIDEFGTGTEPMLGGAIAESVLAELNRKGAYGVITTHYTNLKHFAAQTEGLHNGAMLFDTHAIQPLFRLQMGQPGGSFAFEIARKIGLPESILAEAKEKMGQEHLDFDKHLREIVRDKHYWENKRQSIKDQEKRLSEVLERYNKELERIKQERKDILSKAKQKAEEIMSEANSKIENTIRGIKEAQAEKERTKALREEVNAFRQKVADVDVVSDDDHIERKMQRIKERQQRKEQRRHDSSSISASTDVTASSPSAESLVVGVGDSVIIDGDSSRRGEVLAINGKDAQVAIGNLKTNVKLSRLSRISNNQSRKAERKVVISYSNVGDTVREKKLNFKPELDVRGLRADEAIEKVSAFVDEAILCEQSRLSILHGKGNGILRQMIRQWLNAQPFVKDVHDEHVQFGGAGISIVELDM
ncbi:MAG: Smr/MutS family protein [Bacteroidales bacterium]|nr:Smr/MutS family protein [Bacteroidales bacterium]